MTSDHFNPMADFYLGFREITPDQMFSEKWKEFIINIGGTQALQEIKVPERAGGYAYKDQVKLYTRNRFLYWRTSDDVLELVEHSLDVNLTGNSVRYRFQDTAVLEGVSVHETDRAIVVLVATVSSVHRLSFPHPDLICNEDTADFTLAHHPDIGIKSIFADATLTAAKDPSTFYVINNTTTNSTLPHMSASLLTVEEDSLYALAYSTGVILLVRMSPASGEVVVKELKEDSYVPRFLFGIAGVFMGNRNSSEAAVSMALHCIGLETYLFCLYRDGCMGMWSCGRVQCVSSIDLLHGNGREGHYVTEGVQSHVLRKAHDARNNQLLLGVYLCFAANSEICLVKPVYQPGSTFQLNLMCTLQTPANDLVDLVLSSRSLWAVWRGSAGQTLVSRAVLNTDQEGWHMAQLEPAPDVESTLRDDMDVSEQYMAYIFQGGRFSMAVITRALSLFRRSTLLQDLTLSYNKLRERVSRAVESDIQRQVQGVELTDEDYMDVAYQTWTRFYSDCVQYNESSTKPVGLVLIGESGIALIKRQQYSLLRPMDQLEHLFLVGTDSFLRQEPEDSAWTLDVVQVVSVLALLEELIPDDMRMQLDASLAELSSPEQSVMELLDTLAPELGSNFLQEIARGLQTVGDVYAALAVLIQTLTLDLTSADEEIIQATVGCSVLDLPPSLACLYGSSVGNSVIAQSLFQMASVRFSICRNLLILQQLLLNFRQLLCARTDSSQLDRIRSVLAPRIVVLTQAYYSVVWLGSTPAARPSAASMEVNAERLAVLGMSGRPFPTRSRPLEQRPLTLLELLMGWTGCTPARALLQALDVGEDALAVWHCTMGPYVVLLGKLIWPICNNFLVPQCLLALNQGRLVQEYVRLLDGWCEWNSCLRKFLLGISLLYSGEHHKALDVLLQAAKGDSARMLLDKVVPHSEGDQSAVVQYYLLLIKIFTHQRHWDCVLSLAEAGVSQVVNDDELSTLYLVAFTEHLRLGHHADAFNALASIPDRKRGKLCLRQLVETMFERMQLEALMDFPHQSMFVDLEEILMSRARAMDLQQCYYNFLYSFHMKQGNVRKAASVMFEQGMRFSQEMLATLSNVQRQANCYLACLNALHLASSEMAWIVKPTLHVEQSDKDSNDSRSQSPKRHIDGAEVFHMNVREHVEILQMADIEREYQLTSARVSLLRTDQQYYSSIVGSLTPRETVTACTNAGLYEVALSISQHFSLPLGPVLAHLAAACVDMTKNRQSNAEATWEWLKYNDVWEFGIGDANALDLCWKLLEVLLMQNEAPHQSTLHKAVTQTLVRAGFFLPHWLLASYRQANAGELLRELLSAGRLEDAAQLAEQLVWAVLGRGREQFGLSTTLGASAPPVYVPVHTLDRLVLELRAASKHNPDQWAEISNRAEQALQTYKSEVKRVSEQMSFQMKKISASA